ncbi:MAG: DNA repair protein RecO [Burkholderiales bacterium]
MNAATRRRNEQEPAFVLHSYAYKETSLIVEAFTRHRGRLGLLARGARRPRSAIRGLLLAFHPLRLGWTSGAELGTLTRAEWVGGQATLAGLALICGFYMNELLLRLLPREDPHEGLFDAYGRILERLAAGEEAAPLLRAFELGLLRELGYAPPLDRDAGSGEPVRAEARYAYAPERGPVALAVDECVGTDDEFSVAGQTLLDMARDDFSRAQTRDEARALLRRLIAARLPGQSLHTRDMLKELQEL